MPKLIVHHKGSTKEHEFGSESVTMGRSSSSPVVLPDERASREHCTIEFEDGKWYAVDLDSSNGTFMDGRRITREELKNGAVLRIGDIRISFIDESAPKAEASSAPLSMELRATGGPCDGQAFKITKPVTRIGRSQKNDIVLKDHGVSKRHAELMADDRGARIIDKKSRNGIKVNKVRISERDLDGGDQIAIGSTMFEFIQAGAKAAAAAAPPSEEGPKPEEPKTGLSAVLTTRVKILAAVVAVIIVAGILSKTVTKSGKTPKEYPDNLLNGKNPSFEHGSGAKITDWRVKVGSGSLDPKDAEDGACSLRLVSAAGAGPDLSAVCWSSKVPVSPGHAYELSALVKNYGTESAALCAAWFNDKHPWLSAGWTDDPQLGRRTDSATEWRRVSEMLRPPSWAGGARFGCAVLGQGAAKFDGIRVRRAGAAGRSRQVAAGRVAVEAGRRGEFIVSADGTPILGGGRAVVSTGGQTANQSLAVLQDGFPQVELKMIKVVGKLGLAGNLPFTETVSSDGSQITLHYDIDVSAAPDTVVALELLSDPGLLAKGVTLEKARGGHTVERGPFENKIGVGLVTILSDDRRVFLRLGDPATVSATKGSGDAVNWRFEFPTAASSNRFAQSLVWSATDRTKYALVAAHMQRAADAEGKEEFGKAAKLYQDFIQRHGLYTVERFSAGKRLKAIQAEVASRIKAVKGLAARASGSQEDAEFEAAERECDKLLAKLKDHPRQKEVDRLVARIRNERKAAIEKKKEKEATDFLVRAKGHIERGELHTARAMLEYVIKKYPGTKFAAEAAELIKQHPKPE